MTRDKQEHLSTETIDLSGPVPHGFHRIALGADRKFGAQYDPASVYVSGQAHDFLFMSISSGAKWAAETEKSSLADLLASWSFVSAHTVKSVTAAACVEWMNIFGPNRSTRFVKPPAYTEIALRFATVAISPSLKIARDAIQQSAFVAPSGAQLVWSEVIDEEDHG